MLERLIVVHNKKPLVSADYNLVLKPFLLFIRVARHIEGTKHDLILVHAVSHTMQRSVRVSKNAIVVFHYFSLVEESRVAEPSLGSLITRGILDSSRDRVDEF